MSLVPPYLAQIARILQSPVAKTRVLPLLLAGLVWLSLFGPAGLVSRMLLLAQYGVLLLWQPVFDPAVPIRGAALLRLMIGGLALLVLPIQGVLVIWLALLASLFGSRTLGARRYWLRHFHLGVLICLLILLWLVIMPRLAGPSLPFEVVGQYGVPLVLLLLAFLPVELESQQHRAPVDFFYAVLILLLALLAPLSAVAISALSQWSYVESLASVLIGLGLGLGLLGWLWNPRAGFAGIGAMFSMRVLQLGTPFEKWSARLAEQANKPGDPYDFLHEVAGDLLALPGVLGGFWEYHQRSGRFGRDEAKHNTTVMAGSLGLVLYSDQPIPPALRVQFQLIVELLNQFQEAKQREARMGEQAYVAAVHQTGARLTHDVKNLLQTLKLLLSAAETTHDAPQLAALYARQLPEITRRLEMTLDKLAAPGTRGAGERVSALSWWGRQQCRYADSTVEFQDDCLVDGVLDEELFGCALDNLLGNALNKRHLEAGVRVVARLECKDGPVLTVTDSGSAIPGLLAERLFDRPVASTYGFGLGLYQVAQLACQAGHSLRLVANQSGLVCFQLAPIPRAVGET